MKLDEVTAEIRPRGKWESIDLGVALVQRNMKSVFLGWLLTVGPVMLIIGVLSYLWYSNENSYYTDEGLSGMMYTWFPVFIVWWLKPIFDRVPLYILSRSLFGETLSISQLVVAWPKMLYKGAFTLLVTRRISLSRSFTLPIYELEGLRKSQFKKRVELLRRSGGEGASSLTISSKLLGGVLIFSGYITFRWLTMYGFSFEAISAHVDNFFAAAVGLRFDHDSVTPMMFMLISYMITVSVLAPFYSAAGFALYINSRTISEGWDIELAFKRMSQRLAEKRKFKSHSLFSFIAILGLSLVCVSQVEAQTSSHENDVKSEVNEILHSEDFDLQVKQREVQDVDQDLNVPNFDLSWLGGLWVLFKVLFILVVVGLLAWLIYLIVKNLDYTKKTKFTVISDEAAPARTVLGMNITPESLPDDVLKAARDAWHSGDKKLALSFLYRGSLEWMVNTAKLPILESNTENDCVAHCNNVPNPPVPPYFTKLTHLWVGLAYGNEEPDDNAINWLTSDWPFNQQLIETSQEVNE